jgi:hypothetical protein
MAGSWTARLARGAVVAAMVAASAVAIVVWRPEPVEIDDRPVEIIGAPAPDLADEVESWVQGDELDLQYVRDSAVLLLFWHPRDDGASEPWIDPVVALARRYEDEGLVTVGLCVVGLEDWRQLVRPVIRQHQVPFRMALDCDGDLHIRYLIDRTRTPYCYLLACEDDDWTIVWGGHPEVLNESVIEHILAGP